MMEYYTCPDCKFDQIPKGAKRCLYCKTLMDWSEVD